MDTEIAYNLALDYLYSHIDYSLKKISELARANFDLGRMRELAASLGDPQISYPIIHVAGTKGKGSTSALLASAMTAAGYRTGLYTSPHLMDYAERIRIDGQPISHKSLTELVEEIKPVVEKIPSLTTFEITTALGFLYFARKKIDAAVIEVGLGGRLDATNIVLPQVSVITPISYDHMAILGNTLASIAGEKAGIIKSGIPVVSSPQKAEAWSVLEKVAGEKNAPLTLVGRDVTFEPLGHSLDGQSFSVMGSRNPKNPSESVILRIPLLGTHQVFNAATAFAALRMSGLNVKDHAIRNGFDNVSWPCRFEILQRNPPVVIDSAHNADSAGRLSNTLEDYFPDQRVIWVFSILEDKDVEGMIREMRSGVAQIIATQTDHPRVLEVEKLVKVVQTAGVPVESLKEPSSALERALELAGDKDVILVAGSVAFAGEMKAIWEARKSTQN
jgi:dihydrofolate synthase/folylpolyglutamate synthase